MFWYDINNSLYCTSYLYVLLYLPPYIHYCIQQDLAGVAPGDWDPSMFTDTVPDTVSSPHQQPG